MERRTCNPGKVSERHKLVRNSRKIKDHGELRLLKIKQVDTKNFLN